MRSDLASRLRWFSMSRLITRLSKRARVRRHVPDQQSTRRSLFAFFLVYHLRQWRFYWADFRREDLEACSLSMGHEFYDLVAVEPIPGSSQSHFGTGKSERNILRARDAQHTSLDALRRITTGLVQSWADFLSHRRTAGAFMGQPRELRTRQNMPHNIGLLSTGGFDWAVCSPRCLPRRG